MARFSERINKRHNNIAVQLSDINNELRNGLWNILTLFIMGDLKSYGYSPKTRHYLFIRSIWLSFFKEPIDKIPYGGSGIVAELRSRFYSWDWLEVYDFIDFIASEECDFDIEDYIDSCNYILKREFSGYRFVGNVLSPITDENEINSIENALENSGNNGFNGVKIHLESALNKLSDRNNPDYRNSIKESISAVESICQVISGKKNGELGKTLKLLNNKIPLHGALLQGFNKLYGYTSDGDGIRHAMMEADNLDQEDALFMLIACSSFINYLIVKSEKSGLLQND